jgi:hypothetical protein
MWLPFAECKPNTSSLLFDRTRYPGNTTISVKTVAIVSAASELGRLRRLRSDDNLLADDSRINLNIWPKQSFRKRFTDISS